MSQRILAPRALPKPSVSWWCNADRATLNTEAAQRFRDSSWPSHKKPRNVFESNAEAVNNRIARSHPRNDAILDDDAIAQLDPTASNAVESDHTETE